MHVCALFACVFFFLVSVLRCVSLLLLLPLLILCRFVTLIHVSANGLLNGLFGVAR